MRTMQKAGHAVHDGHRQQGLLSQARGRFNDLMESDFVDAAKQRGGEMLETAQVKGQQAWKSSSRWIKKNPGAAVGIAFAVGVVMTALIARSRKEETAA